MSEQQHLLGLGRVPVHVAPYARKGRPVLGHLRRAATARQLRFAGCPSISVERVPRFPDGSPDYDTLEKQGFEKMTMHLGDPVAIWMPGGGYWSSGFVEYIAKDGHKARVGSVEYDVGALYPLARVLAWGKQVEPLPVDLDFPGVSAVARTREGDTLTFAPTGAVWFGHNLVIPAAENEELLAKRLPALVDLLHLMRTYHLPRAETQRILRGEGVPLAKAAAEPALKGPVTGWIGEYMRRTTNGEELPRQLLQRHVHLDQREWSEREQGLAPMDLESAALRRHLAMGLAAARAALLRTAGARGVNQGLVDQEVLLNVASRLLHSADTTALHSLAGVIEVGQADLWPTGLGTSVEAVRKKGPLSDEELGKRFSNLSQLWIDAGQGVV